MLKLHLYKASCHAVYSKLVSSSMAFTLVLKINLIKKKPKPVQAQLEHEFFYSLKIHCRCYRTDVAQLVTCDRPKINAYKKKSFFYAKFVTCIKLLMH